MICLCGGDRLEVVHTYQAPPEGEVGFGFSGQDYLRQLHRCRSCGHFLSTHEMNDDALYDGEYVDATYGDLSGMTATFERINKLPAGRSDNFGRVRHVHEYCAPRVTGRDLLDVGSGLCVFPYRMKAEGWDCTALDTDARQVRLANEVAGVRGVQGVLGDDPKLGTFDVITFNKVLEHVKDPVAMLRSCLPHLHHPGVVYIELPDGEAAIEDELGPGREEFFIEHHHAFSAASIAILIERAGLTLLELQRLQEPSTKYTLRAFAAPRSP